MSILFRLPFQSHSAAAATGLIDSTNENHARVNLEFRKRDTQKKRNGGGNNNDNKKRKLLTRTWKERNKRKASSPLLSFFTPSRAIKNVKGREKKRGVLKSSWNRLGDCMASTGVGRPKGNCLFLSSLTKTRWETTDRKLWGSFSSGWHNHKVHKTNKPSLSVRVFALTLTQTTKRYFFLFLHSF